MPWWLSFLFLGYVDAHISLLFPPARYPSLDYFSSQNTNLPCGVPKPAINNGVRTFLKAGSTLDIEWITPVPHSGGIRLEVLNAVDEPIALFANFRDEHNITEFSKKIELPLQFECPNCAIRITLQATEYGDDRVFYSCADVNILNAIPDGDSCLSNGKRINGKCICNQGYTGDYCQHKSDCNEDSDCGDDGICTSESHSGQCFCPPGKYGEHCQRDSSVFHSLAEFNESQYNLREADGNKIYWRIVADEIEMVLQYPGESWVAVGWKPKNYQCKDILSYKHNSPTPNLQPKRPTPEATELPRTSEILTNNDTSSSAEECGPNEEWSNCAESSRDCEASCDWTKFPETIPNCPRVCGISRCVCKEGFVRMTNDEDACVPFDFCDKETEPTCSANSTWAKCGTACEPSCSNMYDTSPCPATCQQAACTCADNYVRFQDNCIYWGDCPDLDNNFHLEEDKTSVAPTQVVHVPAVSVDVPVSKLSSTPSSIGQCAVNETIVECGRVCEPDCISIFTRGECDDCGHAECSCLQGYARNSAGQCVYWGDCPVQGSGLETKAPTTKTTTKPKTSANIESTPKVEGDICFGEYRYPAGCRSDCEYKILWSYVEEKDEIEFSLETRIKPNSWTGIGFSQDGSMVNADMLIVKSLNGALSVHDMTSDGYAVPVEDKQNDIQSNLLIGSHQNGILRAQFNRKRNTGDSTDKQFDGECWKMMFPITGGRLDSHGNITTHTSTPLVSDRSLCISSCQSLSSLATSSSSSSSSSSSNAKCEKEFRFPSGCEDNSCEYIAQWDYDSIKNDVKFTISSKNIGRWTGIGFSKNGEMSNSDIYTGWFYEGKAQVLDRFAYGRQLPAIDPADRQDIYDIGGNMKDDIQTISFRRKVITADKLTDFPLDECYYFLFPIGGGRVLARKSSDFNNPKTPIGYHDLYQPRVSSHKICICDSNGKSIPKEPTRVRARRQTPKDPFTTQGHSKNHGMDCADMVVGMVSNGKGRVRDFYSPSKATPREDSYFGGSDSLTSSAAFQQDGITTVVFRRKLAGSEKWDHSIEKEDMTVLWAKGADPHNYQHTTGGQAIEAHPDFFSHGSFKYHGKNHRGLFDINFFQDAPRVEPTVHGMSKDSDPCIGQYSYPSGCTSNCIYTASWMSDGNVARFTVKAKMNTNEWRALGFSTDGNMASSDVIILAIQKDKTLAVTDQYMANYGKPIVDEIQDIFDVETSYIDGLLVANFSRDLFSSDSRDVNLQECVYLLYSTTGGKMELNGEIQKHSETPIVSKTKICLHNCLEEPTKTTKTVSSTTTTTAKEEKETTPTTVSSTKTTQSVPLPPIVKHAGPSIVYEPTEPIKARYGLRVRILNRNFVSSLSDPQSEYYQSFTKDVTAAIDDLLEKRWKGMRVSKIIEYSKGSVIAEFEVTSIKDTPRSIEMKSLVEESAIRGQIGGFDIEPTTVKANHIDIQSSDDQMKKIDFIRNVAIIAGSSLVLIILVFCTCCALCRIRRSSHKFSPMGSIEESSMSQLPIKSDSYPVAHPATYPYGTLGLPRKTISGFDNAAYGAVGQNRQYSQATTASTRAGQQSSENDVTPQGVGETTYQEWMSKVGSKPASQEHEEAGIAPHRPPSAQPYVSYPNDPSGYYTLRGEHKANVAPKHQRSFQ